MLQLLENASENGYALIDFLSLHTAHAQKAICDTFCNTSIALAKRLQMFFQQKASLLSHSVLEAAPDAFTYMQGDVAYCQWNVR